MTWKDGDLLCDWCGGTVILKEKVTQHDREFNTGWTKCSECVKHETPMKDSGTLDELPDDYFAPEDPLMEIFGKKLVKH